MEAHCSSYIQRSSESQLGTPGVSGALSTSLSAYISTFEETRRSLPNSQPPYMQRELNANPMAFYSSSTSVDGAVGHMFSSSPRFSTELYYPPVGPSENTSRDYHFRSQLLTPGASLNNDGSWLTDPSPGFFNYSVNTPIETSQVGRINNGGCPIPSEDHSKTIDQIDWLDQPINDDHSFASNWNDFFFDSNVEDPQPKVIQSSTNFLALHPQPQLLQIPTPPWQSSCAINSTSSSSGKSKQRMRWTPELHDAFVKAVSEREVSGKVTAKGVWIQLKATRSTGFASLTIDHVRSHLQKYRAATNSGYKPESLEGYSETRLAPIQEDPSPEWKTGSDIPQALRFQLELQKRLHEQLENHRKLQLQVEQYGKFLQKILLDNQCQGASTSSLVSLSPQRRHAILTSLVENEGRENDGVIEMTTLERVPRGLGEKQKALETLAYDQDLEKMLQGQVPDPQSKRKRMKGPLIP